MVAYHSLEVSFDGNWFATYFTVSTDTCCDGALVGTWTFCLIRRFKMIHDDIDTFCVYTKCILDVINFLQGPFKQIKEICYWADTWMEYICLFVTISSCSIIKIFDSSLKYLSENYSFHFIQNGFYLFNVQII